MKKMIVKVTSIWLLIIAVGLQGCTFSKEERKEQTEMEENADENSEMIQIGITLYSIQNEYTKRFAKAAQEQAGQMGIELQLYDGNYDASLQNTQIEEMIQKNVDGILIIPQDTDECVEGVEKAMEAGIPVVSVNTRVNSEKIVSYVGSNDIEAGEIVAKSVVDILNEKGNIVIIEGPIGQSAQVERLEGIKNILSEHPNIHVIGKKTANWSRLEAQNVMKKWMQTFDQIDAVIAENDDMALGALEAIAETDKEIYVVGIDGSEEGIEAVEERKMYMTVFQDAESQSKKALEIMVKYIKGESVDEKYWIPLKEITAE